MGAITAPRVDEAVARILPPLQNVFGPHLRAAIVKGSAVKGDFIPFYSDLDVHAFLERAALMKDTTPRVDLALAFREAIGHLNPEAYGFGSFQIIFLPTEYPADWSPSVPGTYRVLLGDPEAIFGPSPPARYVSSSRSRLDQVEAELASMVRSVVDKTDRALARQVRLFGAYLKGQIYNAAVVITGDPLRVWQSGLDEVVPLLEPARSSAIRTFFSEIRSWPERRGDIGYHKALVQAGLQAMSDLAAWWAAEKERSTS